jgi:hypothetical protein
MSNITEAPTKSKPKKWPALTEFLRTHFYDPDMDALRIALSAYVAHFDLDMPPVWLYIIGPPGTGKTAILIKAISFLPSTWPIDDFGANSFLSGFGENNGALPNMTQYASWRGGSLTHGILYQGDITTFLGKNPNERDEVNGILRGIYDGTMSKPCGNKKELIWKGKCTIIGGVTPRIDHYYNTYASLGQRFLSVRWPLGDAAQYGSFAMRQLGKEKEIEKEFKQRIVEYVDVHKTRKLDAGVPDDFMRQIDYMSQLAAWLRGPVNYVQMGAKRILDIKEDHEAPTRIIKGMFQISRASAKLARRDTAGKSEMRLCHRIIEDSFVQKRWMVTRHLPMGRDGAAETISLRDLKKACGLEDYHFDLIVEELKHMGVIDGNICEDPEGEADFLPEKTVWMSDRLRGMLQNGGFKTPGMIPWLVGRPVGKW